MTLHELSKILSKLEGRKSQVKIGDIRELLSLIATYDAANRVKMAEKYSNEEYLDQPSLAIYFLDKDASKKAWKAYKERKKNEK